LNIQSNLTKMNTPDFLIVGAAKGGTTSLYYYLKQHPQVFFSAVKEPCFFCFAQNKPSYKVADDVVLDFTEYKSLFNTKEKGDMVKGEATAIYLYMYENVINNLKKYIPGYDDIRIVMILRNPADRAFSQYMMNVRDLVEPLTFEEAIEREEERKQQNWSTDFFYLDRGLYYKQVKAYLDEFKHVKIYFFEDLLNDSVGLMKDLCEFLQIDPYFKFSLEDRFNVSGRPKHKWINNMVLSPSLLKRTIKAILPTDFRQRFFESAKNKIYAYNLQSEKLSADTRRRLIEYYRSDITDLQKLVGRDLSKWLQY